MLKRMPIMWKSRDVRLTRLPAFNDTTKELWETIINATGMPNWFSLDVTRGMDPGEIKKRYNGLRNRAWFAGYRATDLIIVATEKDGICFSWQAKDTDAWRKKTEKLRLDRRKARLGYKEKADVEDKE